MSTAPVRRIAESWQSRPTLEGAGVHLRRAFGHHEVPRLDPFLMLDDFRSGTPEHYRRGFPWHPHRGIETITYVLDGEVEHEDSLGNGGVIGSGDLQWMTAGSGILHQEMPKGGPKGRMDGFQLWANLPAKEKMTSPRYRDAKGGAVPVVTTPEGATVRVIAGEVGGARGPMRDIVIDPEYLDVSVPAGKGFAHAVKAGHTVFAYVFKGEGRFGPGAAATPSETLVLYGDGERVVVAAERRPVRFLLVSGRPLREPVAWYGPIVMNTQEELQVAFEEFEKGTFVKPAER